jgi:hypothetical protein
MTEQIPLWAWWVLCIGAGILITALIAIIGYTFTIIKDYLNTFFAENTASWKEVREGMTKLISIIELHEYKIDENKRDLLELKSDIKGLPKVHYEK